MAWKLDLRVGRPRRLGIPVFGAAAAISTLISGRLAAHYTPRAIWSGALSLMAAGVVVPVFVRGITGIIISVLAVGGTFMVGALAHVESGFADALSIAAAPLVLGA